MPRGFSIHVLKIILQPLSWDWYSWRQSLEHPLINLPLCGSSEHCHHITIAFELVLLSKVVLIPPWCVRSRPSSLTTSVTFPSLFTYGFFRGFTSTWTFRLSGYSVCPSRCISRILFPMGQTSLSSLHALILIIIFKWCTFSIKSEYVISSSITALRCAGKLSVLLSDSFLASALSIIVSIFLSTSHPFKVMKDGDHCPLSFSPVSFSIVFLPLAIRSSVPPAFIFAISSSICWIFFACSWIASSTFSTREFVFSKIFFVATHCSSIRSTFVTSLLTSVPIIVIALAVAALFAPHNFTKSVWLLNSHSQGLYDVL